MEMAPRDSVVQHPAKKSHRVIGPAQRSPAVLVEPADHAGTGNLIQRQRADGRTRTPRPAWRECQTVCSRDVGISFAPAAAVRRLLLALMPQPSRAAPTASAARRTIESARRVYLSVVSGSRCPSSRPIVNTISPSAMAMLAYEWRKS